MEDRKVYSELWQEQLRDAFLLVSEAGKERGDAIESVSQTEGQGVTHDDSASQATAGSTKLFMQS